MGLWLNQWDQYLLPDFSDIAPNQKPANPSEFADCTRLFESVRVISISRDLVSLRTVLSAVIVGADGEVGNLTSCGIDADKYPEFGSMNIVVDDIYHDAWLLVEVKMDLDAGTVNSFLATMVKKNIGNEDAEFTGMDERERMEYMCAQLESAGKIILHPENYLDAEEVEIIAAIPTKDLKEVKPKTIVEKTLAPSKMRTVATPEVDEAFDDLPDLTGGEEDQPIYAGESDGEGDGSFGEDSDF
jgi:hypothetical protein